MRFTIAVACVATACAWVQQVEAQAYPDRPIRIVVPFPPGGSTDFSARILAAHLPGMLKQTIVIDNRGGAGGNIGADIAAKVTPTDTAAARAAFPITDSSFDLRVPAPVPAVPTFATIRTIIDNRCVDCHNNSILNGGVSLVSEAQVRAQAANIYNLAAISDFMPQGNSTGMTQAERDTIAAWFKGGRP